MKDLNIKVKTALILIGTLLLGILMGAMLYRAISQHKIRELLALKTRQGFARNFERAIRPTAGQQEKVQKILDKYAGQFSEVNREHMEKTRELVKSMREELADILTPEQMKNMRRGFLRQRPFRRDRGFGDHDRLRQFPGPDRRRQLRRFQDPQQRGEPRFPPGEKSPQKKQVEEKEKPGSKESI